MIKFQWGYGLRLFFQKTCNGSSYPLENTISLGSANSWSAFVDNFYKRCGTESHRAFSLIFL